MGFYNKKSRGRGGRRIIGEFSPMSKDEVNTAIDFAKANPNAAMVWQGNNPKGSGTLSAYRYDVFKSATTLLEYDALQDSLLKDEKAIADRNEPDFIGDLKDGLSRGFVVIGAKASALLMTDDNEAETDSDSES